jgi:hypothetical protein
MVIAFKTDGNHRDRWTKKQPIAICELDATSPDDPAILEPMAEAAS